MKTLYSKTKVFRCLLFSKLIGQYKTKMSKEFIGNLRNVANIIPFWRCWTPSGFVTSLDGGRPGLGATVHAIAEKNVLKASKEKGATTSNGGTTSNMSEVKSGRPNESPNLFLLLDWQEELSKETRMRVIMEMRMSHPIFFFWTARRNW